MKKFALTVSALAIVVLSIAQELVIRANHSSMPSSETAVFKWDATTHEFGTIKAGVPVTHEFSFTNTGSAPLIISSVQTSCGCTVTEYSKDPIEPGGTGHVKATYNAAKVGQFTKTVTVNANTDDTIVQLTLRGEVVDYL
ncbi:MAG TPA: DUF1573 domain-containing protein [Chryseosolibacter sp.]|nr:DUF1573 domain-containing protein [Chryseosolibacter sp.]